MRLTMSRKTRASTANPAACIRQGGRPVRGRDELTTSKSPPRRSSCLTVSANSVLDPPMAWPGVGSGADEKNPQR